MRIFYGALFLLINLVSYRITMNKILIFIILTVICLLYINYSIGKGTMLVFAILELMCYTWSSSWRNIFGGAYSDLPLPWFYVLGIALIVAILVNNRKLILFERNITFFYYIALLMIGIVPLLISNYFRDALTEYITIVFFLTITVLINSIKLKCTNKDYESLINAFVSSAFLTSLSLIFQCSTQIIFKYDILNNSSPFINGDGNGRLFSTLMFYDISGPTICFAVAVLFVLYNPKVFKYKIIYIIIVASGMVVTSSRTGFYSMILTFFIYIFTERKVKNRFKMVLICTLTTVIGFIALSFVRTIHFGGSGRIEGYVKGFLLWLETPFWGLGFSDEYLNYAMGIPIPHLTFLNLLIKTGIIYVMLLVFYLLYYFYTTIKGRDISGKYVFICSMIGSCFIPSFFEAKFFTIVVSIIAIRNKVNKYKMIKFYEVKGK